MTVQPVGLAVVLLVGLPVAAAEPTEPTEPAVAEPTESAATEPAASPSSEPAGALAVEPAEPEPSPMVLAPPAVLGVDSSTINLLRPLPPATPWGMQQIMSGTARGCVDQTPGMPIDPWCRVAVEGIWGPASTGH